MKLNGYNLTRNYKVAVYDIARLSEHVFEVFCKGQDYNIQKLESTHAYRAIAAWYSSIF